MRTARRRGVLQLAFGLMAVTACGGAVPQDSGKPPHVVVILVDTLRADHLGCYGYERDTSPTFDALAARGVLFERAISVGGNTSTAMPAIFTGRLPFFEFGDEWGEAPFGMDRFRTDGDGPGLPTSMTTLAEYLHSGGYSTAGFITNPYLKSTFSMDQGFDNYVALFHESGVPYGRADELTDLVIDYLNAVDFSKPQFLYLHYMDVHGPYRRPEYPFGPVDNRVGSYEGHYTLWGEWEIAQGDYSGRRAELRDYMIDAYDTSIHFVDGSVARILADLEAREVLDSTLVVVTSDHGEEFLEHGGTTHKGSLFDEIVHVPLLVRLPCGPSGMRVRALVRNFDIMPTVLELVGIDRPPSVAAASLVGLVHGSTTTRERIVYAGFPWLRMIRDSRFKLLVGEDGTELLYDLVADPGEMENLLDRGADGAFQRDSGRLRRMMDSIVESLRAQGSASELGVTRPIDPTTREQLRALGYIN